MKKNDTLKNFFAILFTHLLVFCVLFLVGGFTSGILREFGATLFLARLIGLAFFLALSVAFIWSRKGVRFGRELPTIGLIVFIFSFLLLAPIVLVVALSFFALISA